MAKNIIKTFISLLFISLASSCTGWLDVKNGNMIGQDGFPDTDEEINAYVSSLYDNLPVEDFMYYFSNGSFRFTGNTGGLINADLTRDCMHSEWGNFDGDDTNAHKYWETGYNYIYKINKMKEALPTITASTPELQSQIEGEVHFFTAYAYFQLAKRYGGVSLVKSIQEFNGDYEEVKVPRSSEKATWDYIMSECDLAAEKLSSDPIGNRATKWAALALKSRAMLFAASVAKILGQGTSHRRRCITETCRWNEFR